MCHVVNNYIIYNKQQVGHIITMNAVCNNVASSIKWKKNNTEM